MSLNERYMEQAEAHEEAMREEGQHAIQRRLLGPGSDTCEDCGCTIPAARRKAAPWATCCTDCQTEREHRNRHP